MKYKWNGRVRYSEVDDRRRITLPGIINYFQDCSTFQSEDLGVGCEFLEQHQKVWVLSSWQIMVDRYPKLGEQIEVQTFATGFDGLYGTRNFVLGDARGERAAYANSMWVLMDLEKGRPVKPGPKDIEMYGVEEPVVMDYAGRKIALPEEMEAQESFAVQRHQMDSNHHVNNCQYVRMALDMLKEPMEVRQLRVEYKKSAVYGDIIYPSMIQEQNVTTIALNNGQGKPYAIVELRGE